jgi:hypothetical protein
MPDLGKSVNYRQGVQRAVARCLLVGWPVSVSGSLAGIRRRRVGCGACQRQVRHGKGVLVGRHLAISVARPAVLLADEGQDTAGGGWCRSSLEGFSHKPEGERLALLDAEPPTCGDEHWDVFLAALAEQQR